MFHCSRCLSLLRKTVNIVVEMPAGRYKDDIKSLSLPDVTVIGANWQKEFWFCSNCGWHQVDRKKPRTSAPPPSAAVDEWGEEVTETGHSFPEGICGAVDPKTGNVCQLDLNHPEEYHSAVRPRRPAR